MDRPVGWALKTGQLATSKCVHLVAPAPRCVRAHANCNAAASGYLARRV
jgi:hypothetical protein